MYGCMYVCMYASVCVCVCLSLSLSRCLCLCLSLELCLCLRPKFEDTPPPWQTFPSPPPLAMAMAPSPSLWRRSERRGPFDPPEHLAFLRFSLLPQRSKAMRISPLSPRIHRFLPLILPWSRGRRSGTCGSSHPFITS